jgi:hypothetical protein
MQRTQTLSAHSLYECEAVCIIYNCKAFFKRIPLFNLKKANIQGDDY